MLIFIVSNNYCSLFCYICIMKSTKLDNDKYYTPIDLAKECINKTFNMDYGRIK